MPIQPTEEQIQEEIIRLRKFKSRKMRVLSTLERRNLAIDYLRLAPEINEEILRLKKRTVRLLKKSIAKRLWRM